MRRDRDTRGERQTREQRERLERGRYGERGRDYLQNVLCVRSERSRVYFQNARVLCGTGVLKVHTGAF